MQTQARILANYNAQIEKLKEQIELEKEKKKTDWEAIAEWQAQIDALENQIADLELEMHNAFMQTDIKSYAQELGDILVDAFNRGGIAALDMADIVRTAIRKIVIDTVLQKYLEDNLTGFLNALDYFGQADQSGNGTGNVITYVDENGNTHTFTANAGQKEGEYTYDERWQMEEMLHEIFLGGLHRMEALNDVFDGIFEDISGENGLAGSIKGITAEQASAIEGYLNAMRMNQIEANNYLNISVRHLSDISNNTYRLHAINNNISNMSRTLEGIELAIRANGGGI